MSGVTSPYVIYIPLSKTPSTPDYPGIITNRGKNVVIKQVIGCLIQGAGLASSLDQSQARREEERAILRQWVR